MKRRILWVPSSNSREWLRVEYVCVKQSVNSCYCESQSTVGSCVGCFQVVLIQGGASYSRKRVITVTRDRVTAPGLQCFIVSRWSWVVYRTFETTDNFTLWKLLYSFDNFVSLRLNAFLLNMKTNEIFSLKYVNMSRLRHTNNVQTKKENYKFITIYHSQTETLRLQ